jgi:aryl-alcohol dehydrogenase-like predicted oxidoreductase
VQRGYLEAVHEQQTMRASSRIALGTAQLGLPYGIANRIGQVPEASAREMLALAQARGVDTIDTAVGYGTSEAALGAIGVEGLSVVTKLPAVPEGADVERWVEETMATSLARLRLPRVHGVLLHRPAQLLGPQGAALFRALERLKARGLTAKIGCSIYSPAKLDRLLPRFPLDLVQAPLNVLDRRLVRSGWLERLGEAGVEVHARSAFLQGLLLSPEPPRTFDRWRPAFAAWWSWLERERLPALAACLGYVLSHPAVSRVVVGAESVAQLAGILDAAEASPVAVPDRLATDDEDLIDPTRWLRP